MTGGQLEKLIDAGFTHDEIMRLARDEPAAEEEAQEQTEQTEQEAQEEQTEPAETEPAESIPTEYQQINNRLDGMNSIIKELLKAVQNNNLKNDYINSSVDSLETQTDEIMKSIIRPTVRKDEK